MSTTDFGALLSITSAYNGLPTTTWTTSTNPTSRALADMLSALDATMSATDPLYTHEAIALADGPAATANALSILFEALPSSAAMAIASEYGLHLPTHPTTTGPQLTSLQVLPTSLETQATPQILLVPSSISGVTRSTPIPTSSIDRSPQSSTVVPSSTRSLAPVFTTTRSASEHFDNSAIAGIISGVIIGTLLIILAVVILLRRRQQGKRPWEHRKVYPEVAWLYDPAPTPVAGSLHSRHDSGEEALLRPRPEEMEEVQRAGPGRSPRVTSPLLPPPQSYAAELGSPKYGRTTIRTVRKSSASFVARPMHAVFEESSPQ